MAIALDGIYRKSATGRKEFESRSGVIDALARSALILINGRDSLAVVEKKLGRGIGPPLQVLIEQGFVEPVPVDEVVSSRLAVATGTASLKPASSPGPEILVRHQEIWRKVRIRLAPHFGPDLMVVLEPLMKASSDQALRAALDALEKKLALYLGRKAAAALFEDLRP